MKKKKILHLITGLEIGGAEMMLLKTLPLMQKDFDNRICCMRGHGPIGKKLEGAGITVYYLDLKNIFDFKIIFRFKKIIRDFAPDILVTYLIHADLFGRIFGKIFGVKKIICSQRGSLLQWEFLRKIDRLTKFLVTKYIVQTKVAKQELMQKLNLPEEKFVVIPNAIDLQEFNFEINKNQKKQELKISVENINITCVSKLRMKKGHEYLLEAFEQIFQKNNALNLLIVGDGEQKQKLINQISNYKSRNNIYFLGNRNDVKEILKISDIFVLPTLAEGMSNAIMEAMASDVPVITTNIDVNQELIENNKTGILVPAENSKEIAEKILELLNNKDKPTLLSNNAKNIIQENFSISAVVEKIINLYSEL